MSSSFGEKIRVTIFGESHGESIGCVIDGLPAGLHIDFDAVNANLQRRAPGTSELTTARREADRFTLQSGVFEGKTTGAPLAAFCPNLDTRSHDYLQYIPRPGHADYPAYVKRGGMNDFRGGGHFSGRITAPLVYAGSIIKQMLFETYGIRCEAETESVHGQTDSEAIRNVIGEAKLRGDSVGGIIGCRISGVPVAWGEPFFDSIESVISHAVFSIPAVKGIEFGDGFSFAGKYGSEVSDGLEITEAGIRTIANHNGGIFGGLSNGSDIAFRVVFKPTPTISLPQQTVDLESLQNIEHAFGGRHDPCVVLRAAPIVESAAAIAISQFI